MAEELRKFMAPEFVFGQGALDLAGQYAANFGAERVLLVSDPGVAQAGWTAQVRNSLEAQNLDCLEYLEVTPNPRDVQVMEGARLHREHRCDVIVAVGGGSPMDCAKGIGIVVANDGQIGDYEGADRIEIPIPPLICIPTTAGSSADVSQFAIITDTRRMVKMAIVSKVIVPDAALIDPATLLTMPQDLTMATGMDALVHALEAYVSNAASPFTDLHALEAVRLVHQNLPLVLRHPTDPQYRIRMMRGSLEAGLAFSNASLGAVHAMAHSLGGLLDFPHGECNARLLGAVVRMNFPGARERYRTLFRTMGWEGDGDPLVWFDRYLQRLLAEGELTAVWGEPVPGPEILDQLAVHALADPCMVTNPHRPTRSELRALYEQLFRR